MYFRSLQPISEAGENKDDPPSTECNNVITNDSDGYLNIKNQSLNVSEKPENIIVDTNVQQQQPFKESYSPCLKVIEKFQEIVMDSAVRVIQAAFKRFRERRRFLRIKKAVVVIQRNLRKWIQARHPCLRPAEFERQSSDGAKSDEYRESEEGIEDKTLTDKEDDISVEQEDHENANEEIEVDLHESEQNQLNTSTDEAQEINSNNSSEYDNIELNPDAKQDNTSSRELNSLLKKTLELNSTTDETRVMTYSSDESQKATNLDLCDIEQKELNDVRTKDIQETATITYSCDVCYTNSTQCANECMEANNITTISLEYSTDHQQNNIELSILCEETCKELRTETERTLEHKEEQSHVHGEHDDIQDVESTTVVENNEDEQSDIIDVSCQVEEEQEHEEPNLENIQEHKATSQENGCLQECLQMNEVNLSSNSPDNTIEDIVCDKTASVYLHDKLNENNNIDNNFTLSSTKV